MSGPGEVLNALLCTAVPPFHAGQLAEAERHFVVAGHAEAAVRMWLQAGAVDDALRVAAEGADAATLAAAQEAKVRPVVSSSRSSGSKRSTYHMWLIATICGLLSLGLQSTNPCFR